MVSRVRRTCILLDERHFYFAWVRGVYDFFAEEDHEVHDTSIDHLGVPHLRG